MRSSTAKPGLPTFPIRFTKVAAELLLDFANTRKDGFARFDLKWGEKGPRGSWRGGEENFFETQRTVRDAWEGKAGPQAVAVGLGLLPGLPAYYDWSMPLLRVNWEEGSLWLSPRDLNEYVWLSLLQYSQRLGICANKDNGCPTPYFLKSKPNQKYCSDGCALPAQREFKRQWWESHGQQWRRKRAKKKGDTTKGRR